MMPSTLPSETNSTSRRTLIDDFNRPEHNASTMENLTDSDPFSEPSVNNTTPVQSSALLTKTHVCEERNLTFSFVLSADSTKVNSSRLFTHFVKARKGIQIDLYSQLGGATEVTFGSLPHIINVTETIQLCSDDKEYDSLIIIDFQNDDFNEEFDVYSEDLIISDASDEAQCEQVREFLGFEPNYIDDFEICREFNDIKCDYQNGDAGAGVFEKNKGGAIPGFKGFEFKPVKFDGFEFLASEFVGFEFEGFEPSADLTFNEIVDVELAKPNVCRYQVLLLGVIFCFLLFSSIPGQSLIMICKYFLKLTPASVHFLLQYFSIVPLTDLELQLVRNAPLAVTFAKSLVDSKKKDLLSKFWDFKTRDKIVHAIFASRHTLTDIIPFRISIATPIGTPCPYPFFVIPGGISSDLQCVVFNKAQYALSKIWGYLWNLLHSVSTSRISYPKS